MYKAYLVISQTERKLTKADDVDYLDYSKIFQCPECSSTLTLRQQHWRSGHEIRATFVHPEGKLKECSKRVSFDISSSNRNVLDLIEKGQSSKKLEKAFVRCLKSFLIKEKPSILEKYFSGSALTFNADKYLKQQISYNEMSGVILPNPEKFIAAAAVILKSRKSQKFIEQELEQFCDHLLSDKKAKKAREYFADKNEGNNLTVEVAIRGHCRILEGVIKFLCQGASDDFRKQFLSIIIWGDPKLKLADPVQRQSQIERLRKANPQQTLKRAKITLLDKICEADPQYLSESFSAFYQGGSTPRSEFIHLVLSIFLESIQFYDWSVLPSYY